MSFLYTQDKTVAIATEDEGSDSFGSDISNAPKKKSCLSKKVQLGFFYALNTMALLGQISGLALMGWGKFRFASPVAAMNSTNGTGESGNWLHFHDPVNADPTPGRQYYHWLFPLCLFIKSVTWWENFVDFDLKCGTTTVAPLRKWKVLMHKLRQKAMIFTSLWNIGIVFTFPLIASYLGLTQFASFKYRIKAMDSPFSTQIVKRAPVLANGLSPFVGFLFGSLACKLLMQRISYDIPLLLATPLTVGLVVVQCKYQFIPNFGPFEWYCPEGFRETDFLIPDSVWQLACCGMFWISLVIITCYLWRPKHNPMDKNEK